jgi:basic membrane lipoprotein Med (substrate-binding protein (PBP1-ABC) superfamily)
MPLPRMRILFSVIAIGWLAGCAGVFPRPVPTVIAQPTSAATSTAEPTVIPFIGVYVPSAPLSPAFQAAEEALTMYAKEKGWQVETFAPSDSVTMDLLGRKPILIAGIGSGMGAALSKAATENTGVRFLVVDDTEVVSAKNLLVVGSSRVRKEEAGFMAGLLAGLENANHRVGWIGESGTVSGRLYRNGFLHGIHYYCPLCSLYEYEVPPGAPAAAGQPLADSLLADYVDTASAAPGAAGDAALAFLTTKRIRVSGTYPGMKSNLVALRSETVAENILGEIALHPENILRDLLTQFLAGEQMDASIAYSVENGGLQYLMPIGKWITPGKQALIQEAISNMKAGRLSTGVDGKSGESQ